MKAGSSASSSPRLSPGTQIGHFLVMERIGAGGMGVVYRARDTRLGRLVALKVLGPEMFRSETARRRFLREAQVAAAISHPHIATVHEVDQDRGMAFIAMEYVPGVNLKDRLTTSGHLAAEQVIEIGIQACEALEAAHQTGIVHRDIKSSNIMITPEGQVKVLDFGLAKAVSGSEGGSDGVTRERDRSSGADASAPQEWGPELTREGTALGTVSYMSPEQASGAPLDARSDVFSLGVVLYEASTGVLPFRGTSDSEIARAIRVAAPESVHALRPDLPRGLSRVISRCLAKEPEKRYASAILLARDLARLKERRRSPLAVAAVVVIALVAAAFMISTSRERAPLFGREESRLLAVGTVENRTGDADFEGTVEDILSASLDESPLFKVVPRERLDELVRSMGIAPVPPKLSMRLAREACLRGSIPVLVTGQLARVGPEYLITVRLWEVERNREIGIYQERAEGKPELLDAIDRLTAAIRERAGESLAGLAAPERLSQIWTSSSWEALRLYSQALERYRAEDTNGALALLERATRLDPSFAMAHARAGRIYDAMRDRPAAETAFRKALEHLDRLGPKERGLIESEFYLATHQFDRALGSLERIAALYPVDPDIQDALGYAHWMLGEYEAAAEALGRAIRLSPATRDYHYNLANIFLFMGDYDRAEREIEQAARLDADALSLEYCRGYQALLGGRPERALEHFRRMSLSADPWTRARALLHRALTRTYLGQYARARELLEERIVLARSRGMANVEAESHLLIGRIELDRGRPAQVRLHVERALALPLDPHALALAGEMLARSGAPAEARALEARFEETPETSPMTERLIGQLRAEILMADGELATAVTLLEEARSLHPFPDWSEPLARALLAAGELQRAAEEYQRIRDRRGDVFMRPGSLWGPPLEREALLQLAEIRERQGRVEEARELQRLYLESRDDADRDVPGGNELGRELALRSREGR